MAAGSFVPVTSRFLTGDENNLGGTYLRSNSIAVAAPTSTAVRIQHPFTTGTSTVTANNYLALTIASGAVDFTLEFGAPQFEQPTTANRIRNFAGTGAVVGTVGSGGVLPTNWVDNFGTVGLSIAVMGTGIEDDISYVDFRVFGTATLGSALIRFEATDNIVALPSQTWTASSFVKRISGSLGGVLLRQYIRTVNASNVTIANTVIGSAFTPTGAALGLQRRSATLASTEPLTAFVTQLLAFEFFTAGQVVDFTLRIACPQLEPRAFASPASTGTRASFFAEPARAAYLVGTPAVSGSYPISVSSVNSFGTATGTLSLPINPVNDTFTLSGRTGSVSGLIIGTSPTVTVTNTSAIVTSSTVTANEGTSVTFTITPNYTGMLYWSISGVSGTVNASDFTDANGLSGSISVVKNTAYTVTKTLNNDVTTEGTESFNFATRIVSITGTVLDTTTVTISDTSITPPATAT